MPWLLFLLLVPSLAEAACVPVETSMWTQDQKNLEQAVAYELAFLSGHNEVPIVSPTQVCFQSFDPIGIIDGSRILARYASDEADRQAASVAEQQRQQALRTEVATNDLCTAELADLDTRIDNGVNGITDLASAKTFFRIAMKKIARCLLAVKDRQR